MSDLLTKGTILILLWMYNFAIGREDARTGARRKRHFSVSVQNIDDRKENNYSSGRRERFYTDRGAIAKIHLLRLKPSNSVIKVIFP